MCIDTFVHKFHVGGHTKSTLYNQCFVRYTVIIVAFSKNATVGYSLESVCVCVCVFVCVCFCTITQKEIDLGTRNRNTL